MTDGLPSQLSTPGTRLPLALHVGAPQGVPSLAARLVDPPTATAAMAQGAVDVVGTAIDVTFGTHWAILEYWDGNKSLKRLRGDAKDVRAWQQALPTMQDVSLATRQELSKNARAQLLFNRYDRNAQRVKRDIHGLGVGTGGLVFGTGMALNSTVFGSFSSAVAATSTPIALFAGTPILSGAAVLLGAYEGLRVWRMHRLHHHLPQLLQKPVVGNEARVHAMVKKRLAVTRRHAKAKAAAMFTLAAAAPLLVVGIAPGLAVGIPGVIVGLGASYYRHTRLLYEAPLSATACLALGGRRDIGNRIDLADREYQTLKDLKTEKRPFYPRGSNGIPVMRDIFSRLGALRRWWTPPKHVAPAHHTVMRFLRAQAGHELNYLRQQQLVMAHESNKTKLLTSPADRQRRLSEIDHGALYMALRSSLLNKHIIGRDFDVIPSASEVCTQFMRFIETHQLDQPLLHALQNDKIHKTLETRGILLREDKVVTLKKAKLQAMVDAPSEHDMTFIHDLSAFYERFLLNHEKKIATAMRNQLAEFLLLRTYANARAPRSYTQMAATL